MRRLFFSLLVVMPLMAMAQMKLAVVDVQAIFNAMPAAQASQQVLSERSHYFEQEYKSMQDDFNAKYAAYQKLNADPATPPSILKRRTQEIQEDNAKIDAFLNSGKTELDQLKLKLEQPIYQQINDAIKAVASEQGLTYVLDVSRTPLCYTGSDAIDITGACLSKLGIK